MVRRWVALILVVTFVTGCQTGTNERILMHYNPAQVQVLKAPYNGEYRLYQGSMPATGTDKPLLEQKLTRGDMLGFSQEAKGKLFALLRDQRTPLNGSAAQAGTAQSFTWTVQPDPGQIDPGKTALLVFGAGAIVAAGVGIAVGVSAAQSPWGIPTWP